MHNSGELTNHTEWSLIEFQTTQAESELLSDLLWSLGVVAIEELPQVDNCVVLRTSVGQDPEQAVTEVLHRFPSATARTVKVARSVSDTWRNHALPTWVNDTVALVPAWLQAPENSVPIFIEPADTFGLGNHPTTVLALRLALRHASDKSYVFDLGCGSGVLAIAVAQLLDCRVDVFDIADGAKYVVQENCRLNNVQGISWVMWPNQNGYEMVLANILAPVLITESTPITRAIVPGGFLILSGMRDEQTDQVLQSYKDFTEISRETIDGWTAIALLKTLTN